MTTAKYASLFPSVSQRWRELIQVNVHGAANLPLIDGEQPQCYVTAQSKLTLETQDVGGIVNATNVSQGVSPHWNEMIYVEIPEDKNRVEELVLLVLDKRYDAQIADFRLPWKWFEPFYQYHFNLEYNSPQSGQIINLYVSMMLKKSALSKENTRYYGLETLLNSFDAPITLAQSIYAVARIVPNYRAYRHDYLTDPEPTKLGITFQKVAFPSSEEFRLPESSQAGYPQISSASKLSRSPTWKHNFFFTHPLDKDNMFTSRTSALVIEFYPFHPIANNDNWRITGLLGWVAVLLDSRSYDSLTSSTAENGLQTNGLIVESEGDLTAQNSKFLTASIVLRLITERHPSRNLLFSNHDFPVLPSYQDQAIRQDNMDPVYRQASVSTSANGSRPHLPAIRSTREPTREAVREPTREPAREPKRETTPPIAVSTRGAAPPTFLPPQFYQPAVYQPPVYQSTIYQPPQPEKVVKTIEQPHNPRYRVPRVEPYDMDDLPTEYRAMIGIQYPPRSEDDIDGWFDYFQRMITVYKQTIRRVIQDVAQLREQHKTLSAANQDLKSKVDKFDKKRKVLIDIFEGDKLDRAKLQDIYNGLNAKIAAQSLEIKENHARISSYEKELARRAELRAQYDSLIRTIQSRETELKFLKERVTKADGLEETVRRQEVVIERLEGIINNYMKQKRVTGVFSEADQKFLRDHAANRLENSLSKPERGTDYWEPSPRTPRSGGLK